MPVHFAGQPCDMDPILDIARQHDLRVIEDAAHAFPAYHAGRMVGTIGDATCFSFYANKTITTGEGGMLTTDDDEIADRVRTRSLHGMSRQAWNRYGVEGSWYYEVTYPGYKYNMTDIAAAIGLVQLSRSQEKWQVRRRRAERFRERFATLPAVEVLDIDPACQHAWHLFVIRLVCDRLSIDRDTFIEQLRAKRIGTSVHYMPLHMHPYYRDAFGFQPRDLPIAAEAYGEIISLPLFSAMTEEQVDYVADSVEKIAEENQK
jgi:perosamine synthetase